MMLKDGKDILIEGRCLYEQQNGEDCHAPRMLAKTFPSSLRRGGARTKSAQTGWREARA